jgi:hypothetical protein
MPTMNNSANRVKQRPSNTPRIIENPFPPSNMGGKKKELLLFIILVFIISYCFRV